MVAQEVSIKNFCLALKVPELGTTYMEFEKAYYILCDMHCVPKTLNIK